MVFKNLYILVPWVKVASASEGLRPEYRFLNPFMLGTPLINSGYIYGVSEDNYHESKKYLK